MTWPASQVLRISRVVADLTRAEAFYGDVLGFRRVQAGPVDPATASLLGLPAPEQVVMRLGTQEIALVACTPAGPPYPEGSQSNDLWFQHLAIVVGDMAAAFNALSAWPLAPITEGGPQRLPPWNGGVGAFKFRDPDGHPLELLQFPARWRGGGQDAARGPFLGIDHSALSIRSARHSLAFYRRLGFRVANRSFNQGPAQSRLDGLPGARVHVTSLRISGAPGPGLELLRYMPPGRPRPPGPANACLTDWVTLGMPGLAQSRAIRDPDGHVLLLQGRGDPALGPAT